MKKTIYLIRHAEPYFDFGESLCLGKNSDPLLSVSGKNAAREFAVSFKETAEKAGCVYTSPLKRAKLTAFEIAAIADVPLRVITSLSEMDAGDWDGKPICEINEEYAALSEKEQGDEGVVPPHGESYTHGAERMSAALSVLASNAPQDTLVVVAHAIINRALLCKLTNTPFRDLGSIPQEYLQVNTLEYDTETGEMKVV